MCEPEDDAEEFELSQLAQERDDEYDDTCDTCSGTGEGQYDGTRCRSCNGSGINRGRPVDNDDFEPPEPDYCDEEGNRI